MYDAFITGASGFIGSHLVQYLLKRNKSIVASYHMSENMLKNFKGIKKVKWDITKKISSLPPCKVWYHLASLTDIHFCNKNPKLAYKVNTNSIDNIIKHAEKSYCETFVLVSTLGVYGEPIYFPTDENHPMDPVEIYSISKEKAEKVLINIKTKIKKYIIVRPFNTFGPRQNSNMLIPSILNQIFNKSIIKINNIKFTRDFLYVSDIVNGIFLAAKNGKHKEIYNLGSGTETSVEELINIIKKITGNDFQVINKDIKPTNHIVVKRSQANIKKASADLLWKPNVSLENGLKITTKYFYSQKQKLQ